MVPRGIEPLTPWASTKRYGTVINHPLSAPSPYGTVLIGGHTIVCPKLIQMSKSVHQPLRGLAGSNRISSVAA